ncbi:MAG: hypothetical protein HN368_10420 [Spirochaetales bacterium]|nr:hypothetical protein [Spirochaetales bacterium]
MRSIIILVLICMVSAMSIYPQELTETEEDLAERTLALDIRTATYFELTAWCEQLGLSARGGRSELQSRIESFYGISGTSEPESENSGNGITIESADRTKYFDEEIKNEQYLQLLGNVVLVMDDGDANTIHQIVADRIIYNESLNSITASGNLTYTLTQPEKAETFTGDSLTINLDDWRGIFIQGTSTAKRSVQEQELTFYYTGKTIYRLADDTVILNGGTITSSIPDDPFYHIDAGKILVLGPNEWALSNAVLFIGRIPVFYFPFFFHPGNELTFHPATGYRDIEGYYLQTTTYLIGQREKKSSTLSFLQVTDDSAENYQTERKGIYLEKIRKDNSDEVASESTDYIKILFDAYSRLGLYAAVTGSLKGEALVDSFDFSAGLALSRDVFKEEDSYTYLLRDENGTYSSRWNRSNFLGVDLPFRFGLDLAGNFDFSPLSLKAVLPLYSDPWFTRDFYDRKEQIDWASLIGIEDDDDETKTSTVSARKTDRFSWNLTGNLNPQLPDLKPFIQTVTLNRISLSMSWRAKSLPAGDLPGVIGQSEFQYPEREFYAPESYVLPSLAGRISGTILPFPKSADAVELKGEKGENEEIDIRPPWEQGTDEESTESAEEEKATVIVPDLQRDLPVGRPAGRAETRHSLSYSLVPDLTIDSRLASSEWQRPEDIDFSRQYSIFSTRANGSVQYVSNPFGSLLGIRETLGISSSLKKHFGSTAEVTPNWENLLTQDKQSSFFKLNNTAALTLSPFLEVRPLSQTAIQYSLTSTLYQLTYDAASLSFLEKSLEWDKEIITAHNIGMNFIYLPLIGRQEFSFSSSLPPVDLAVTFKVASETGPVTSTISGGASKVDELGTKAWKGDPLVWSEKFIFLERNLIENVLTYDIEDLRFSTNRSSLSFSAFDGNIDLTQSFTYDFVSEKARESTTGLKLWWFTSRLLAADTVGYTFFPGQGWEAGTVSEFRVTQFISGFSFALDEQRFWKDRIRLSGSIDSAWRINLIRATDSNMDFGFNFSLGIAEFLNLTISSRSVNKSSYLYIPNLAAELGKSWLNPIGDIARSFNFFSRSDRENSVYNLENITVSLVHEMPDWNLNVEYTGNPDLVESEGSSQYEWAAEVSVFVQWKPIPEIKRKVTSKDGEITL